MLPKSLPSSPAFRIVTKTKTSFSAIIQSFFSVQNPRAWVLFIVLSIQILLFFNLRRFPTSIPPPHHHFPTRLALTQAAAIPNGTVLNDLDSSPTINNNDNNDDQCGSGRVYVYDLPKFFNQEILDNCDNLNPWSSRCDALSNNGFGQSASEGLSGIIPENLLHSWYWTDQFVSEIIFHNRILNHKCRTTKPESAAAFYIPFYAGLAVGKYLWLNSSTAKDRDRHCEMMLTWLQNKPHYKQSNGWDHFITMGRITWDFRRSKDEDWGSSCIYKAGLRNITRLLIEKNPWDYFDIGVPYPTGFHPDSYSDVIRWQSFVRERERNSLFCFAGAPRRTFRNDFRAILLNQCREAGGSCREVDCGGARCFNGTSAITETFLDSDFCLQPRGDSFTRRSIFDCMIAGSIPVFFWRRSAYLQYQWFLPDEPGSYSVYIDREAVKNGTTSVKEVLESYSKEEVRNMREKVIEYIPRLVYAKDSKGIDGVKDAFDFALEGVLTRFKEQLQPDFHKWK